MGYSQEEIAALVRQVVGRTIGRGANQTIINEEIIREVPVGATFPVPSGALITPLARQIALERRIKLDAEGGAPAPNPASATATTNATGRPIVALGADHGGYQLKERLKGVVAGEGYGVIDCGTNSADSVDYPDYAFAVARLVSEGRAWRGIVVDGAGIGSCMVANKVPGVRAALCYDQASAVNSREHNNANVLTLGAGLIGANLADQIVRTWLATEFGGGRHARRVDKIDAIGDRFLKKSWGTE